MIEGQKRPATPSMDSSGSNQPESSPPFQFAIWHLLVMTAIVALLFGLLRWMGDGGLLLFLAIVLAAGLSFRETRRAATIGWILFAVFVLSLLLPAVRSRPRSRRSECLNNLKQIALALLNYEADYRCFPPPYVADAQGRPLYSWRVLILPYLERNDLYKAWHFDEAWNGPNNSRVLENLRVFKCPKDVAKGASSTTSYLAVVGPETMWPENQAVSLDTVVANDGPSDTLLLVEVAYSGIHWAEPRDLHVVQIPMRINPPAGQGISSKHPGCAIVSFADGHQEVLFDTIPPEQLHAILTVSGGEKVDRDLW